MQLETIKGESNRISRRRIAQWGEMGTGNSVAGTENLLHFCPVPEEGVLIMTEVWSKELHAEETVSASSKKNTFRGSAAGREGWGTRPPPETRPRQRDGRVPRNCSTCFSQQRIFSSTKGINGRDISLPHGNDPSDSYIWDYEEGEFPME